MSASEATLRRRLSARDVRVGSGVILEGELAIGSGVILGHHSVIGYDEEREEAMPRLVTAKSASQNATILGAGTSVSPFVLIEKGTRIGKRVGISEFARIGACSVLGDGTAVEYGAKIYNRVRIGRRSIVAGFCCNDSVIGDCSTMMGHLVHSYKRRVCADEWNSTKERPPAPKVEDRAVVGYNAIVIGDVTVGHDSYVAAGAIITKDVPPYEKHIMRVDIQRKNIPKKGF